MRDYIEHLDRVEDRLTARLERIESKVDLTNGRVTKLEAWRAKVGAVAAVISGAVALVFSVFGNVVSSLWGR